MAGFPGIRPDEIPADVKPGADTPDRRSKLFDSGQVITISIYLLVLNGVAMAAMAHDKWRALHNARRIPERTLLGLGLAGGALGGWAGMYLFRHKTRSPKFYWGMPAIITLQAVILAVCTWNRFFG